MVAYYHLQEVERIDGLLAQHRDFSLAFLANAAMWDGKALQERHRAFLVELRRGAVAERTPSMTKEEMRQEAIKLLTFAEAQTTQWQ